MNEKPLARVTELAFEDVPVAEVPHDGALLVVRRGLGSGLTRRAGEAPHTVWAVGDRGPNLPTRDRRVKHMPLPELGPAITQLRVDDDRVHAMRTVVLTGHSGRAITGLPLPGELAETAIDRHGHPYPGDPSGADTEGIAALRNGGFWIADEYGPSLLRVSAFGRIEYRWIPVGNAHRFAGADYPVVEILPAIVATRRLNRGFEGLALSPDERWLYVALQSPLTGEADSRRVRMWRLDATTGRVAEEWQYLFDRPQSFLRDCARGPFDWPDLKLCELVCLDARRLLVLERGSATSKLYIIAVDDTHAPSESSSETARVLVKSLLLSTDDHPEIGVDIEGVALLSPRALLLVNDNDFGIEGVTTKFWRVDLSADV